MTHASAYLDHMCTKQNRRRFFAGLNIVHSKHAHTHMDEAFNSLKFDKHNLVVCNMLQVRVGWLFSQNHIIGSFFLIEK